MDGMHVTPSPYIASFNKKLGALDGAKTACCDSFHLIFLQYSTGPHANSEPKAVSITQGHLKKTGKFLNLPKKPSISKNKCRYESVVKFDCLAPFAEVKTNNDYTEAIVDPFINGVVGHDHQRKP